MELIRADCGTRRGQHHTEHDVTGADKNDVEIIRARNVGHPGGVEQENGRDMSKKPTCPYELASEDRWNLDANPGRNHDAQSRDGQSRDGQRVCGQIQGSALGKASRRQDGGKKENDLPGHRTYMLMVTCEYVNVDIQTWWWLHSRYKGLCG